ncbi:MULTISPECIES: hypothetical protein [unclassified Candidatus Frackibacter]|uniref:hypothetical protein n=1 Tax=unclassified Candidatus Frackibacter TaxID=2648818 RepID=UPI0008834044|nr:MULTISPECIES: hypothetical protein [unclassified Candidatus Frackibacter]SDC61236.1 hypothetical protein SAMN04515661_1165 [Candidatus Frackibacter sp. WG11]SEM75074.1 hypothetical protein SAMN04488698_1156 [Candidatus Frackibacter sp. WG12]SFL87170.1 hypothetical protein SAMN04488699_11764 [Candidatus Frackibacter sp. WG13]
MDDFSVEGQVTEAEVLELYGYQSVDEVSTKIRESVNKMIAKGEELAEYRATNCVIDNIEIDDDKGIIIFNDSYQSDSSYLASKLKGATQATIGLVSIGYEIEEQINEYFAENNYLAATILDLVGNRLLDKLTKEVWHIVRSSSLAMDLGVSGYYSPGEGDWDLKSQEYLFDLVDGKKIDVNLTNSYALVPQKSLLFIIGQGPDLDIEDYDPCSDCTNEECQFKKNR